MTGEPPTLTAETLSQLAEALEPRREVSGLWLIQSEVSRDDGDPVHVTEGVLETSPEFHELDVPQEVDLLDELTRALRDLNIDVRGWLYVNDRLRERLSEKGTLIYRRPGT